MSSSSERRHINERTLKLIVGLIALALASITERLAFYITGGQHEITSISEAYHIGGWARDYFVGLLFTISAFLFAYNGDTTFQSALAKVAAFAAIGVAVFPCACQGADQIIPYVHYVSAAVMFIALAIYCGIFYRTARGKGWKEANWRAYIYAISGVVMVLSMIALVVDHLMGGVFSQQEPRFVFYGERAALIAFGVSWLVASRVLPVITTPEERKFD